MAWDLSSIYPSDEAYSSDVQTLKDLLNALETDEQPLIETYEEACTLCAKLQSFVSLQLSLDRSNKVFVEEEMHLSLCDPRLKAIYDDFLLGSALPYDPQGKYSFFIKRLAHAKQHYGSKETEAMIAHVQRFSGSNWLSLRKEAIQTARSLEGLSLTAAQAMQAEDDLNKRTAGFAIETEICESAKDLCCRALNAIKAQNAAVAAARGYTSILDMRLDQEGISSSFLDGCFQAVESIRPVLLSYALDKQAALGEASFRWYLLNHGPKPEAAEPILFEQAMGIICRAFTGFLPEAGALAEEARQNQRIDHEKREAKRSGAFCNSIYANNASYVMLTYTDNLRSFISLSHELGHGVHNRLMHSAGYLGTAAPITLKEGTAQFFELLALDALCEQMPTLKKQVVTMQVTTLSSTFLDVTARYLFEREMAENSLSHYYSSQELNGLMLASQKAVLGELPGATYHPLNWVSKPHFYYTGRAYYNYPYIVGRLIAYHMFSLWKTEGNARVVAMLRSSGMCDLGESLRKIGVTDTSGCWEQALCAIRAVIRQI